MTIQDLVPIIPIEALDIRVLSWSAGLEKTRLDTVLLSLICQGNRDEFWAIIYPYFVRIASPSDDVLENPSKPLEESWCAELCSIDR